jgi:hypothetical protein
MGFAMILLLLLNVGKIQTYVTWTDQDDSRRAGVFQWIDA